MSADAGLLDHVAVLHHQHLVGHEAHHRQVVADEDVGQAELVLQVLQQVEHLRLHRHVERAHRLVEHQHLGVERRGSARWRRAGAGRRRTRAGTCRRPPRRRGRRAPSSARARASRSAASAPMPWIAIGSTSVWPTVKRGLSEAYGFWNTIWMRRRIGSHSRFDSRSRSTAPHDAPPRRYSTRPDDRPAVGLVQLQQRQPERRLARARLADHAERAPAAQREADPRRRAADGPELGAAEQAAAQPERLRRGRAPRGRRGRRRDRRRQRRGHRPSARRVGAARRPARRRRRLRRCRSSPARFADHRQPRGARVERRPAGEQRAGVGVARGAEDARRPGPARAPAVAHHHHAVGDLADDAEVVADEQHAHAVLGLQPREQLHDLALDGDVERGGRLVGDQQLRLAGQRHGDHHALLLAARELVRIGAPGAAAARAGRPRRAAPRRAPAPAGGPGADAARSGSTQLVADR